MKSKFLQILGICLLVLLFIAVVVTSVIISNKKKETEQIPDACTQTCFVEVDWFS